MTAVSAAEGVAALAPDRLVVHRRHGPAVAAWGVAAAVPLLATAATVLHLHNGATPLTEWWYGNLALAATMLVPGVLIALRRPANPIGWLLCLACVGETACAAGREYLVYGLSGGTAPGWLWAGWFADSLYILAIGSLPVMLMLFPNGRPLSPRWRLGLVFTVCAAACVWFGYLFTGDVVEIHGRRLANPGAGLLPATPVRIATILGQPAAVVGLLLAVIVIVMRYRRATGDARQQLKWVVWAGSISAVELITEFLPDNPVALYTSVVTDGLLAAAIAIALLKHRLLDIDVVINRTLVFGLLTGLVVTAYVAIVLASDAVFGQTEPMGPGLVATTIVAVAFAPVRSRAQRAVDRLMYGERRNPYGVMTRLGQRLESDRSGGELTVVVDTVTQALKLPYAAIFDASGAPLASSGAANNAVVEHPLSYQGVPVGHLLVSQRAGETSFSREEQQLLVDLARQVGAAVHAVRLSADLQASRQRLVTAKEEERLRLRRDLHDGLGPKLAALGLKLDAARSLITTSPDRSADLLTAVKDDIRTTIDDVRRLVYGLRPPALDELGLVGAIRECVARFDAPDSPEFAVDSPELPRLPAAVEVAAYWIVNEAVTNAVRHAHAWHCAVTFAVGDGLRVLVRDDGAGLADGWRAGVGTSSMAERAAELGGRLDIVSRPDLAGTEVRAWLPTT